MGERKSLEENDWYGHHFRYRLASGFADRGDVVLDAACGIGYGSQFFDGLERTYFGVDKYADEVVCFHGPGRTFLQEDLNEWKPSFDYDIFVSFETIEHVKDYSNIIDMAHQAKKWIITSVPVIPTKHINEWHLHDFEPGELPSYIINDDWEMYQPVGQPLEFSEIYVFKRKSYDGK
jgi:hypothetical protein